MDKSSETSPKRESSSKSDLTKQLFRESEKVSVSESKDTTTGPEGKATEQKKEKGSPLRLSNGLEITQPLAKRFLERQRELQNEKMSPASESKDITKGPEEAPSEADHEMTEQHVDRKRKNSEQNEMEEVDQQTKKARNVFDQKMSPEKRDEMEE